MIWHILVIICGVLVVIAGLCPSGWSDVVFGVLVVLFGALALGKYAKERSRKAEAEAKSSGAILGQSRPLH
jgi:hypothetical protein